eukprot:CAMPEP_0180349406 /NCGR_PEP_ID=MMETSP0989-20121125/5445_1 /TAXON_ID=697907 /ORGANISM="non described non described, Strain CCMP2293" /LENGTH=177 /DNA_ID=CAMNT_0022338713 /DNA_START=52 /DNA_END=581 /DNA_ORIENTATION=+
MARFFPHSITSPWWSCASASSTPQNGSAASSSQNASASASPQSDASARTNPAALARLDAIARERDLAVIRTSVEKAHRLLHDSLTTAFPGEHTRRIHMRGTGNPRSSLPRKPEASTPLLPGDHEGLTRCVSLPEKHEPFTPLRESSTRRLSLDEEEGGSSPPSGSPSHDDHHETCTS